ncbi:MAG TPA: hypothetical protein VJW20_10345 [Candidatus Angelobacter sp.]|nr:hypothetical protein [Candidatus Angelobacter sp.]
MVSKRLLICATLLFIAGRAFCENTGVTQPNNTLADQQAYCQYVTEQAAAQRDLLLTPSAIAGVTQPNAGLPMQSVWGLSGSISNVRKAILTTDAARKSCELYNATTVAQQSIQYALADLEKQALEHRLDLIQQASGKLDAAIATITKMVDAQNATRPMLFSLENTKIKLGADQADTQVKIAALYTPAPVNKPVKQLVAEKQRSEANEQAALDKLNRQNNWDVSLSIGAHQQINPLANNTSPYGAITVSYNLASRAINKHLDQAANSYADWEKVQENDVTSNAAILKQQVAAGISAQANRLKALQEQQKLVQSNLQLVAEPDTTAALDFHNQLSTTQLLLGIEIGDATFRLEHLKDFMENNY